MAKKVVVRGRNDVKVAPPPPPPAAARNVVKDARGGAPAKRPQIELPKDGVAEHRQFPRARMDVRFSCWIGEGAERRFSASLHCDNLSVSGAFLQSTFFLPVGTEMRVSFELEEGEEAVQAQAQIVREERPDPRTGQGRCGFGIKFVEFFGQTEVTLAKLFLGDKLRDFADEYMASKRARGLTSEMDRVVDALAAWELLKVTTPGDPWFRGTGDKPD